MKIAKKLKTSVSPWLLAIALTAAAGIPKAQADAEQAKALFKAMSIHLTNQQAISFDFDSTIEVITKDFQKLSLSSSGSVNMTRPDQLRVTRHGGFANVELYFDGKTVSLVDREANQYAQGAFKGSIEELVDELRARFNAALPGADLLLPNLYEKVMPLITDVKDLGSGVIRNEECDHFAFRTKDNDFQLWISHGENPHPCRLSIVSKSVAGTPAYTFDISNWKSGKDVERVTYSYIAPDGAKKVKPIDMVDYDEVPQWFKIKQQQTKSIAKR